MRQIRIAIATLLGLFAASGAVAHGPPADLAFWGAFPADAARCQRVLSRATSTCISQVAAAQNRCLGASLAGGTCDKDALAARITAARQRALDRLERACTVTQLQNLGYIDLADAQRDVTTACRELDDAAVSFAYGPAMVGGTIAAVDESKAACVRAGASEAARVLRYAMRFYQQALDRIAGQNLTPEAKQRLVDWARGRITRAAAAAARKVGESCPAEQFTDTYGRNAEAFLTRIATQAGCMAGFVYVQDEVVCPAPECGNGMQEAGEECDDGNDFDGDGCRADCIKTECEAFGTTYELIQQAIFENKGCTNDLCHGAAKANGLDLRADVSYENIVDVMSPIYGRKLIEPGDPERSLIYLKLAAKTLPDQYNALELGIGTPMPNAPFEALTPDELEAMRRWIHAAATRDGSVPGVGDLLNACLPEPEPIAIKPLDPPPAAEGVQLRMPQWTVPAKSESEVCFASYYDFTDIVPAHMRQGDEFCYNVEQLRQDPLSHHLILYRYVGQYEPNKREDWADFWGEFRCAGGERAGESCDPDDHSTCGTGLCSTIPRPSVACSGYPPDNTQAAFPFGGAQETNATASFPQGVYRCIPMRGVMLWNSHAFNLTDKDGALRAWVNFHFAPPNERQYDAKGIFDLSAIFAMNVPPFQQQEVCNWHRLPNNTRLFELSSHMHQRGKRWRTFLGEFACQGQTPRRACDPLNPTQCNAGVPCVAHDGRDGMSSLLYTNFLYNDPVQLLFNPALHLTGSAEDRTLTYCALYDNGMTDTSTVRRGSTINGCAAPTHCTAGKVGAACSGPPNNREARDRSCDSSPGAGDGECDACPLRGGVTTEDEMFLLLGSYYVAP